ncbi:MAG: EAL domain-containing protein, partial [Phenylobacterium sp.]
LGVLFAVPPLFWFAGADATQRFIICSVTAGMICGGSLSLAAVPVAALIFVLSVAAGAVGMMLQLDSAWPMLLLAVYATCVCTLVLQSGKSFKSQHQLRARLEQAGQILELLREFDSSGSGWIWAVDDRFVLRQVSGEFAGALGRDVDELLDRDMQALFGLDAESSAVASGLCRLKGHLNERSAFKDLVIPVRIEGRIRWWSLSAKPMVDGAGVFVGYRGVGSDITAVRLNGDDAVSLARRDSLTGMPNRVFLRETIEEAFLTSEGEGRDCTLLMLDLDRFKNVNDTLGHAIGDRLLQAVAGRLNACLDGDAIAGRLGGDEFAVILRGPIGEAALRGLAARLIAKLSEPYRIEDFQVLVGASIGIARAFADAQTEPALTRSADLALYRAKQQGRGSHAFYDARMLAEAEERRTLELDLRRALSQGGMGLAFQPIVASGKRCVIAREALARWTDPVRGEVPPSVFIPIAEESGLIDQLGDWVLREACRQAAAWDDQAVVAVNISTAQILKGRLGSTVLSALAASGLPAHRLELEVTESIFLSDGESTKALLDQLTTLGVKLVLDDFGRGYCSFGYLGRGDFSKLKIDQDFVRAAAVGDTQSYAVVAAMVELARKLGLQITAEGVETASQADLMEALGCTQMQGYFFGRPEAGEPASPEGEGAATAPLPLHGEPREAPAAAPKSGRGRSAA